jgi:hypothetical protein
MQRGAGIRLGRGGVLRIGDVIADVGEQFGNRDRKIGRRGLRPIGHQQPHAVEQHAAKALVVARKIIDARRGRQLGGADSRIATIKLRRAGGLKGKAHARESWIKSRRRFLCRGTGDDREYVIGKVA